MKNCLPKFSWLFLLAVLSGCVSAGGNMELTPTGFGVKENRGTAYTGNLNVGTITHSPVGRHPDAKFVEPIPSVKELKALREHKLSGYEDYVCWGTVEKSPGQWDWTPHRRILERFKKVGMEYVIYPWLHFPPVWYAEDNPEELMQCLEHGERARVVSFFSPKTLERYREFYRQIKTEFGDEVDIIYGGLNGPYGEGNFPLPNVDPYVNQWHSHEGWWIGDRYARDDFVSWSLERFGDDIEAINEAWGTSFGSDDAIDYPIEFCLGTRKLDPKEMSVKERRRWLDFCDWQQNVLPLFTRKVAEMVMEFYPPEKIKLKPGGSCGGINRLSWGTYCPAFAKAISGLGVGLQPADAHGAVFGDKWIYTAYRHYGIPFSSETAGAVDPNTQVRRIFSDASAGAMQLFTYEYMKHAPNVEKYLHLYQGRYPEISTAVYAPTTDYRLGLPLDRTFRGCDRLRDLTDFDVIDELLILDGFLDEYKCLVLFQCEWLEPAVAEKISNWMDRGGKTIFFGDTMPTLIDTTPGLKFNRVYPSGMLNEQPTLEFLAEDLPEFPDMTPDGVWLTVYRDGSWLIYNSTNEPVAAHGKVVQPHQLMELNGL